MHQGIKSIIFMATTLTATAAYAQKTPEDKTPKLEVSVGGVQDGKLIPDKFAYCKPDGRGQTRDAANISPEIRWSGAPEKTKSFAIIMVDKDVPMNFGPANKAGMEIAENALRQNFYHWSVVDIPATLGKIPEGKASNGITPGGKTFGKVEFGITGQNDYRKVSPGLNGGYDGPCPPWNDKRLHRYYFQVYALDVPTLNPLKSGFDGKMVEDAMRGHILAKGEVMGTYSNNLEVLGGEK
ncbi:MAG: YbhB/YbcL family Raf kinase inhibitor-like protein [Alphaproteobacteria bacterium]|nr:YbhB/YbcL family Raf kinase inhibitor-like protein [Alphaproteobacteria bacterium]